MAPVSRVCQRVQDFIVKQFPSARKRAPKLTDDLLQNGVIDSLGVLDVVNFLEREFGVTISDEDLTPEHFGSVERITAYIESKSQVQTGQAG